MIENIEVVAVLLASLVAFCFVCVVVVRAMGGRGPDVEPRRFGSRRPGEEPTAGEVVEAVRGISETVAESKDVVKVSQEGDQTTLSRIWEKVQAAIVKRFPPETGVLIDAFGRKTLLSRGKSGLDVEVIVTAVSRTETLNLSKPAYIWDLRISRRSDFFDGFKFLAYFALAFLFIAARLADDELVKAFFYLSMVLVFGGLFVVAFIAHRRGSRNFSVEEVNLLRASLGAILTAELGQKS